MSKEHVGASGAQGRPDEWIGALVTLPSYVTDEERPYRPTAVMWLETESGLVVDSELVRPEQALARAAGLFQLATREPKAGEPRVPRRLRVSDEALASALRGSVGDVELVVAPTPEMDDVVASMNEYMRRRAEGGFAEGEDEDEDDDGDDGWTFLGPGVDPRDVEEMFAAAARFYEAAPWDLIPADVALGVTCDLMKIDAGAMVVVGQQGQAHGFSLFSSIEDAVQFFDSVEAHERGERMELPTHIMFSFDDRREMNPRLVDEIERHGWRVADQRAYPNPLVVDPDRMTRGLTRTEIVGVTAILGALTEVVESEPDALASAWDDDEGDEDRDSTAIVWSVTVPTTMRDVTVELQAPLDVPHDHEHEHDHRAMASVETFVKDDGTLDGDVIRDYVHAIMHELEALPPIQEVHLRCAEILIVAAAKELGLPITQLTAPVLRDVMMRVLPSGVPPEPGLAGPFVETAELLMAYADEMLGIETATRCRVMLSQPAFVTELEAAFARAKKAPTTKKKAATKKPATKKAATKKAATKKAATKKAAATKAKPAKTTAKQKSASKKSTRRR